MKKNTIHDPMSNPETGAPTTPVDLELLDRMRLAAGYYAAGRLRPDLETGPLRITDRGLTLDLDARFLTSLATRQLSNS